MDQVQEQTYSRMVCAPIQRLTVLLAIPSVACLMVTACYNMADTFFVGQIGTSATAGVGIAYPLMTLIQSFGLMFGKGAGTGVARFLGRRETAEAERVAVLGLYAAFGTGVLLSGFGLLFLNHLTYLLGATDSMAPYAKAYLLYILIAMPFKASAVTLSSILRFQGYFTRSMVGLSSGALLNIALDPFFIFYLGLGVTGSAIATMLSEMFSFFVLLFQFHRKGSIHIRYRNFPPFSFYGTSIIKGGFPSLLKNGLSSIAAILLNTKAGIYGDAAVAAVSIVSRYMHVCQTVFFGVGESCQSICSFNFGAKRFDRVLDCFWFCIRLGFCVMTALSLLSWLGAPQIITVFRKDDAQVIGIGSRALRLQLAMLPFIPVASTAFVMLQGIGKNVQALLVGIGRQGLFLVPILLFFPHFWGLDGLLAAQPVSDFLAFLLAVVLVKPVLTWLKGEKQLQIST